MDNKPQRPPTDLDLFEQIEALLADPTLLDNPLRPSLAQLFQHSEIQRERLERLVKISDGYHHFARNRSQSLLEQYDRQVRRLEKLARISDRYQNSLRELSLALKDAALQDPLTGLGNRRFLMERLKEEAERISRKGGCFSLTILDVDHFKAINDHFGHEAGDQTLRDIAHAIQSGLREYDLCGRWGGEEFLVMLPETSLDIALLVTERIRQSIAAVRPLQEGPQLPAVSASFGLTEHHPGESFSDTLNRADAALFKAKAAGRNRVELA